MILDFLNSGFIFSDAQSGDVWIGWGAPFRAALPFESHSEGGGWVYSPDFFLAEPQPWWWFPNVRKVDLMGLVGELSSFSSQDFAVQWQGADQAVFFRQMANLKNEIEKGNLRKAVQVIFERGSLNGKPFSVSILASLLLGAAQTVQGSGAKSLSLYGLWNEKEGMLGATPETLFQVDSQNGVIQTMALAGTRRRPLEGEPTSLLASLLDDPKERLEHQIVIQGIERAFSHIAERVGAGKLEVGATVELQIPNLVHLYTPICWYFRKGVELASLFPVLVSELHPTPALGAFPREFGQKWLENQNLVEDRGKFGAPFGVWLHGEVLRCLVAIRNLQWSERNPRELTLGAGCGVVSSSEPGREWQELQAKIRAVKKIFQLKVDRDEY